MSKTILNIETPKTQSIDAVKLLLAFVGRASDPMPIYVELKGGVRLTRSKKGDCFYTTTPTDCSCKARTFNPGTPCKHMKALLASEGVEASRAYGGRHPGRDTSRDCLSRNENGSRNVAGGGLKCPLFCRCGH
jgi:hypothetical protein